VVELRSYDPWGRLRNPINWNFDEYQWDYKFDRGYTGHEHMSEYNLINMNGCVYDPWLGRMLSISTRVVAKGPPRQNCTSFWETNS
jgi:hypothetical protein